MTAHQYLLLGPNGKFARVPLPDDVPISQLHDTVTRQLGLSRVWEIVLRKDNAYRLDQQSTLAASGVPEGGRILVEATQLPRAISLLRSRVLKAPPTNDVLPRLFRVMPCYLAVDTSASMYGGAIDQINAEIPELQYRMTIEPQLTQVCQLSVVTFDESARVHTPLGDVTAMRFEPLHPEGRETNFRAAFEVLREVIADDVYRLYLAGLRPQRPVVFFLTDGKHSAPGDWSDAIVRLAESALFYAAPHLLAFGFGDAVEANIIDIGRTAAYMPTSETALPDLQSFMKYIGISMRASAAHDAASEDDPFRAPRQAPGGWRAVRVAR
jgi:uncharacterized protein YegL